MSITLQSYDQVIALSQANINETLRRHFCSLDARDELGRFKAILDLKSINAQVLPPTVELVDKDNADGALYIIHLGEGSYTTVVAQTGGGEENDEESDSSFKKVKIPTNGWELAFDVDFAFKPILKIPEDIVRQVPLPGGYSVQQLMINFGDVTRIVQLDRGRSKFPIPPESKDRIDATALETGMEFFLKTYLNKKLSMREGHNILGFAVKVDEAPKNSQAHFLPTDSKVQIVGYRADGKKESFRLDNPYNAFCFTEMTKGRMMPTIEIQYSGNWFYDSIGGSLVMSRSLFWDTFMIGKVKKAHVKAVEFSGAILGMLASDKFEGKGWCLDDSMPTPEDMCGTYKGTAAWGNLAYSTTYKSSELTHWNKSDSNFANFWSSPRATVHTLAKPRTRQGEMVVQQDIEINWEEGAELADYFYLIAKTWDVRIRGSLTLTFETTISFKSVSDTGGLRVESTTRTTRKEYNEPNIRIGGLVSSLFPEGLHTLINEWASKLSDQSKDAKEALSKKVIDGLEALFGSVAEGLKHDLNQLNKFVFPGSGTFDIKDPLFSDKGDLMLGLTYR
ncbi:MAG: hypothetical protein Q9176_007537 [Flavoplaca citrina]